MGYPFHLTKSKPMNDLLKKGVQFGWKQEQEDTFQELKQAVQTEPMLLQPNQKKPFKVEIDASNYALAPVLMQKDNKEILHRVAYFSKPLNAAQRNYDVYNCELLGLVETCRHFRLYMHLPVSTPIMQIYCTGRIQENTIEALQDGMQNSWNTTSNWSTFQERKTGAPMLTMMLHPSASFSTTLKAATTSPSTSPTPSTGNGTKKSQWSMPATFAITLTISLSLGAMAKHTPSAPSPSLLDKSPTVNDA